MMAVNLKQAARSRVARCIARWLARGARSAAAVEFAIMVIPFLMVMLACMEVSYDLYVQAALDNLAAIASREVQVGGSQGVANETSATFVTNNVCPYAGGLLNCALITATIVPVPSTGNYYTAPVQQQLTQAQANSGQGICTGAPEQMMVMRLWYDGPSFVGLLVPSFTKVWNGTLVHETIATAGFVNEYFSGSGQTAGPACSL
jgi:Flp pilus assembly protein TadG